MSKSIIVIRAKTYKSPKLLDMYHQLFSQQAESGLIVLPDDFECVVTDPNNLKCEIAIETVQHLSLIRFLHHKWIKGRCRHFCFACKFKKNFKQCFSEEGENINE